MSERIIRLQRSRKDSNSITVESFATGLIGAIESQISTHSNRLDKFVREYNKEFKRSSGYVNHLATVFA